MKTPMKTFAKFFSGSIVLLALNIRSVCTFLFYAGRIDSLFPAACAAAEIVCYLLLLYINFFPALTFRKVSTTRNQILENGIALLQIFLGTTGLEIGFCLTMIIV